MKRLVSFLMVAVMLLSMGVVSAFAAPVTDYSLYYDQFVEEYGEPHDYFEEFFSFENNEVDYAVVRVIMNQTYYDPNASMKDVGIERSGLVFINLYDDNVFETSLCLYDESDNRFHDITKVDINSYDGLRSYLLKNKEAFQKGDIDLDAEISVLDATKIQRIAAQLTPLNHTLIADYNCDKSVDVMDATDIQIYLVESQPQVPVVNEKLVYTPYNDDFDISEGVPDVDYEIVHRGAIKQDSHNMDSDQFGVIIKSKQQYDEVFNFDNNKYDDEFFKSNWLVATVRTITDPNENRSISYLGVYKDTLVLINQKTYDAPSVEGTSAYLTIACVNPENLLFVDDMLWVPV